MASPSVLAMVERTSDALVAELSDLASTTDPRPEEVRMPKAPLPAAALALLREPNPAVIAVVMPSGHPMSVATWYLVEDDGTVLVNMDAGAPGWAGSSSTRTSR